MLAMYTHRYWCAYCPSSKKTAGADSIYLGILEKVPVKVGTISASNENIQTEKRTFLQPTTNTVKAITDRNNSWAMINQLADNSTDDNIFTYLTTT